MEKEMMNPRSVLGLSKKSKNLIELGGICLMLFIAFSGAVLGMLQSPLLKAMNSFEYFSTLTIFSTLGLSIMTPVGGKLGDLFGRKKVIIVAGTIAGISCVALAFIRSIIPFMFFRLLLGLAQGAFTSAPFVILSEINDPRDVPKGIGILTAATTVGGFLGAILAGILVDAGLLAAAILFPAVPLVAGVLLIGANYPHKPSTQKVKMDWPGLAAFVAVISSLTLSLNYGPKLGWGNIWILGGFLLTVLFGILFVKVENKAKMPIIPLHLFRNKGFLSLLLVGFIGYFYQVGMGTYGAFAALNIMDTSATTAGSLQLLRTIASMILPAILGVYVAKKANCQLRFMVITMILLTAAFLPLSFTTPRTSPILYMAMFGIAGIADSFRSVVVTPTAQAMLAPEDLGVGTGLINCVNTSANLFSGAIFGIILDMNQSNVNLGVNLIWGTTAAVGAAGLIFVLLVVRKYLRNQEAVA